MSTEIVALRGVTKRYRVARRRFRTAVEDVDLSVAEGRDLALVGESGSGKSTLLRLVLGLEAPDAGEVRVGGAPLTRAGLPALRRAVGVVAQDAGSSLDPRMPVGASIREPLECLGIGEDRTAELLDLVGLDPAAADRLPGAFSGGERQRIALARAMAPRPRLLVADEPFSAVDPVLRARLVTLLRAATASSETGLLLVSHDLGVVEALCDDVVVLHAGRVAETGPVGEVLARPRTHEAFRLLDAVPRLP